MWVTFHMHVGDFSLVFGRCFITCLGQSGLLRPCWPSAMFKLAYGHVGLRPSWPSDMAFGQVGHRPNYIIITRHPINLKSPINLKTPLQFRPSKTRKATCTSPLSSSISSSSSSSNSIIVRRSEW